MMRFNKLTLIIPILFLLIACGGESDGDPSGQSDASVTFNMKADFATSVFEKKALKIATCPSPQPASDSPGYNAGLDCDNDGGVIQYVTPTAFKVAFKSLDFIRNDGLVVNIIPDTTTLSNALVVDVTSQVTVSNLTLDAGQYTAIEGEIYYYELTMPINDPSVSQTIRIYLSDDDFPSEGNLGHHQGDITFIESGVEKGWISGGQWITSSLVLTRGSIVGAGGTDTETGHLRGLYGDQSLWNKADFMQGAFKDIFTRRWPFSLTVDGTDQTVVFSFRLADSWYFEDFDNNQKFNPCDSNIEACTGSAEWSPIFPAVSISSL